MIRNIFKAWLSYFALRILVWSGGKEILATAINAIFAKSQPNPQEEVSREMPDSKAKMMQNQHLAGIFLAAGLPPQEAQIRSEIFGFEEMKPVPGKMYQFKLGYYWFEA